MCVSTKPAQATPAGVVGLGGAGQSKLDRDDLAVGNTDVNRLCRRSVRHTDITYD
jgi:hypothetical protein